MDIVLFLAVFADDMSRIFNHITLPVKQTDKMITKTPLCPSDRLRYENKDTFYAIEYLVN